MQNVLISFLVMRKILSLYFHLSFVALFFWKKVCCSDRFGGLISLPSVFAFTKSFQKLQCFWSFTFRKTSMYSVLYIFKDFNVFCLLHSKDFNVFNLLRFQRLQCLQSFTLTRLQCLLSFTFQRLQCLLSFTFQRFQCLQCFTFLKTSMSSVF